MFIVGADNCDVYFTNDPQIDVINQKSTWSIGLAFITFFVGILIPSIYLITSTIERLDEIEEEPVPEPALYFDPEARLLFDINTGEVVGTFIDDDREFFFDEDAMILFDEGTGDIVYSAGLISPTIPEAEPVEVEPVEVEPVEVEPVEVEPVEVEPVEVETVEVEAVEAEPVEAEAVEAEPVEAEAVEAEPVEAEAVVAEAVEAEPADAEVVEGEPVDNEK
jgi:hypothetical protein